MRNTEEAVKVQTFTVTRKIKLTPKQCPQCGKRFLGSKRQKFCSRACVQRATYQKHGAAYRKKRMAKYYEGKKAASAQ